MRKGNGIPAGFLSLPHLQAKAQNVFLPERQFPRQQHRPHQGALQLPVLSHILPGDLQ